MGDDVEGGEVALGPGREEIPVEAEDRGVVVFYGDRGALPLRAGEAVGHGRLQGDADAAVVFVHEIVVGVEVEGEGGAAGFELHRGRGAAGEVFAFKAGVQADGEGGGCGVGGGDMELGGGAFGDGVLRGGDEQGGHAVVVHRHHLGPGRVADGVARLRQGLFQRGFDQVHGLFEFIHDGGDGEAGFPGAGRDAEGLLSGFGDDARGRGGDGDGDGDAEGGDRGDVGSDDEYCIAVLRHIDPFGADAGYRHIVIRDGAEGFEGGGVVFEAGPFRVAEGEQQGFVRLIQAVVDQRQGDVAEGFVRLHGEDAAGDAVVFSGRGFGGGGVGAGWGFGDGPVHGDRLAGEGIRLHGEHEGAAFRRGGGLQAEAREIVVDNHAPGDAVGDGEEPGLDQLQEHGLVRLDDLVRHDLDGEVGGGAAGREHQFAAGAHEVVEDPGEILPLPLGGVPTGLDGAGARGVEAEGELDLAAFFRRAGLHGAEQGQLVVVPDGDGDRADAEAGELGPVELGEHRDDCLVRLVGDVVRHLRGELETGGAGGHEDGAGRGLVVGGEAAGGVYGGGAVGVYGGARCRGAGVFGEIGRGAGHRVTNAEAAAGGMVQGDFEHQFAALVRIRAAEEDAGGAVVVKGVDGGAGRVAHEVAVAGEDGGGVVEVRLVDVVVQAAEGFGVAGLADGEGDGLAGGRPEAAPLEGHPHRRDGPPGEFEAVVDGAHRLAHPEAAAADGGDRGQGQVPIHDGAGGGGGGDGGVAGVAEVEAEGLPIGFVDAVLDGVDEHHMAGAAGVEYEGLGGEPGAVVMGAAGAAVADAVIHLHGLEGGAVQGDVEGEALALLRFAGLDPEGRVRVVIADMPHREAGPGGGEQHAVHGAAEVQGEREVRLRVVVIILHRAGGDEDGGGGAARRDLNGAGGFRVLPVVRGGGAVRGAVVHGHGEAVGAGEADDEGHIAAGFRPAVGDGDMGRAVVVLHGDGDRAGLADGVGAVGDQADDGGAVQFVVIVAGLHLVGVDAAHDGFRVVRAGREQAADDILDVAEAAAGLHGQAVGEARGFDGRRVVAGLHLMDEEAALGDGGLGRAAEEDGEFRHPRVIGDGAGGLARVDGGGVGDVGVGGPHQFQPQALHPLGAAVSHGRHPHRLAGLPRPVEQHPLGVGIVIPGGSGERPGLILHNHPAGAGRAEPNREDELLPLDGMGIPSPHIRHRLRQHRRGQQE